MNQEGLASKLMLILMGLEKVHELHHLQAETGAICEGFNALQDALIAVLKELGATYEGYQAFQKRVAEDILFAAGVVDSMLGPSAVASE